jgi:hypothetical protein
MSDPARRGRTIIVAIIAWYLLTDLLAFLLALRANGSQLAFTLCLLVLELVLFFFLYRGSGWARWGVVLLSVLMGLFGFWTGLFIGRLNLAGILVFFCLGTIYLAVAGLLLFSAGVRAYLDSRQPRP